MLLTNNGYIMIGKQAAKGTPITPTITVPFQNEGFATGQDISQLIDSDVNGYKKGNIKTAHREGFSYDCYARPNYTAYFLGWILGADSVAGAGDPYTHTITRDERPWLTIERQLDTSVIQRFYDAKISRVILTGEAGRPLAISIEGNACNSDIITSNRTESYEDRNPFMFYNGIGRFKFATTADRLIKSFSLEFDIESGELVDSEYKLADLPDYNYNVNVSAGFITDDTTRWRNVKYYGSTAPQESVYTAAFEIDCQYLQTSTRQIKVTVPLLLWQGLDLNLSAAANTMTEEVAGIAEKQATTELVTITCMNNIATTIN